jgi:hypothetical protein
MSDITTIKVSKSLRDKLAALGSKDDTFESIIQRLLDRAGAAS